MSLYNHLKDNMITENELAKTRCERLEMAFIRYMNRQDSDEDTLVAAITECLKDDQWILKNELAEDILNDFPTNHAVMTQALLYCLEHHGLKAEHAVRRQDFFNIPVVWYLAKQKNHCLIREMNALRYAKNDLQERTRVTMRCIANACDERLGEAVAAFYYRVKNPTDDDAVMQFELNQIVDDIKKTKHFNESEAIAWLRELMLEKLEADKWTFLSLVYDRYSRGKEIKYTSASTRCLSEIDREALKKVHETHQKMNSLILLQALGMLVGGFTFGIEVGMLILEEAAEEDVLKAWHVLVISAALCWTLGRRLGLFFFRSHIHELEKQSKENYFNAKYGDTSEQRPVSWTAVVGTGAEGILVLFGLVTSGMFTCDMTTMAIRNAMGHHDTYKTDIFGTYFWNKMMDQGEWGYLVASTVSVLLGIVAVGSAVSLTCGHYALDGQETKEYEAKQRNLAAMKRVA